MKMAASVYFQIFSKPYANFAPFPFAANLLHQDAQGLAATRRLIRNFTGAILETINTLRSLNDTGLDVPISTTFALRAQAGSFHLAQRHTTPKPRRHNPAPPYRRDETNPAMAKQWATKEFKHNGCLCGGVVYRRTVRWSCDFPATTKHDSME